MEKCTIILKSTIDCCDVYCDGEPLTQLMDGIVRTFNITPGQHLLEFKKNTTDFGELCNNKILDLAEGDRLVILEEELKEQYDCLVQNNIEDEELSYQAFEAARKKLRDIGYLK